MRHPLHPALVHFPIATWSLATAGDLASLLWGEPAWRFAGISIVVGTLTALAAMAAGFIELLKVGANSPASRDVNRHMLLMMATWCCYAASLFARLDGTTLTRPDALGIALSATGFVVMCFAGRIGGKLVYEHGIGVRERHGA
ncbi:DUF2231 domain-containing protein [Lysobacter panacisoli]|uniref:DUF2231 domain-containing protein n=1 Tax=Lysobacter panacisoli TaxID=1255263 RepID=A0ABP9LAY5_9GAMM|nr:DUF2231 domain-containing protein [Lysobacter panacisoli]